MVLVKLTLHLEYQSIDFVDKHLFQNLELVKLEFRLTSSSTNLNQNYLLTGQTTYQLQANILETEQETIIATRNATVVQQQ